MKIHKILISLFTAVILCSCEKAEEGDRLPDGIKSDLNFHTLEIVDVSYNSATISVKHDGTHNDTWYGFVSDKIGTNDALLIIDKITELTKNGAIKNLNKRSSARIEVTDLQAAKKYKYIVFAITPDGQIYGTSRSITFDTKESSFLLSQCDDWTISYEGRDADTNSENYSVIFNKKNNQRCHLGFIAKWRVESLEQANLDIIEEYGGLPVTFEELGMCLFTPLEYLIYQELETYWKIYYNDMSYYDIETLSDSGVYNIGYRQESGEYYACAIGFEIDDDGMPAATFTYSVGEVNIEQEEPTAEYEKWLGKWQITGANNISYNLRIESYDPNFGYLVYGWECGEEHNSNCNTECTEHVYTNIDGLYDEGYEHFIPFYFDVLENKLNIRSMVIQVMPNEDYSFYQYWGLHGYTQEEEKTVCNTVENDIIATATLGDNLNETTLEGCQSSYDSSIFTYNSLGYVMYNVANTEEQEISDITPLNHPLELPATLVKTGDVAPVASTVQKFRKQWAAEYYQKTKNAEHGLVSKRIKANINK